MWSQQRSIELATEMMSRHQIEVATYISTKERTVRSRHTFEVEIGIALIKETTWSQPNDHIAIRK